MRPECRPLLRVRVTLPKPCNTPGCPELQPCPTHRRKPWARTQRRLAKSGWQQQRDNQRVLRQHGPACYRCGALATQVDHVVPLFEGGADTDANKRPICGRCHDEKTKAEAARARRRG